MSKVSFIKEVGMQYPREGSPKKYRYFLLLCGNCGNEFESQARHYLSGKLKSCRPCSSGMRGPDAYHRTHGLAKHPLYQVWGGMLARCKNESHKQYRDYGGRGIAVCQEWADSFSVFYEWSISNGYEKGLEIDREDNDLGYSPGNCRWICKTRNVNNTDRKRRNNTTGFPGAFKYGKTGRFYSKIQKNGKPVVIGVFDTAEEAGEAYKAAKAEKRKQLCI